MEFEGLVARARLLLEGAVQWIYHSGIRCGCAGQRQQGWGRAESLQPLPVFWRTLLELVHEVERTLQEKLVPEPNS